MIIWIIYLDVLYLSILYQIVFSVHEKQKCIDKLYIDVIIYMMSVCKLKLRQVVLESRTHVIKIYQELIQHHAEKVLQL